MIVIVIIVVIVMLMMMMMINNNFNNSCDKTLKKVEEENRKRSGVPINSGSLARLESWSVPASQRRIALTSHFLRPRHAYVRILVSIIISFNLITRPRRKTYLV